MSNLDPALSSDFIPDQDHDHDQNQDLTFHDLAKNGNGNGTVDETNVYDYRFANAGSNGQQNAINFDDMDSAALLESLANFEPQPTHETTAPANPNEGNSFERLLEAAATAGGQEAQGHIFEEPQLPSDNATASPNPSQGQQPSPKRKRIEGPTEPRKRTGRKKKAFEAEYEARQAKEQEIWGTETYEQGDYDEKDPRYGRISSLNPRSVGVHSAAALFRRPSEKSRKYARPPMASLFVSLQITAEEFLQLQAAAKDFMLDPEHPDRYETVGGKEKGDTDMVKLRLFSCVKTFLDDTWGERLWGKGATEPERQTLRWPESDKRIITLITPLLRRMVTNEKQRRYAIDKREEQRAKERFISTRESSAVPAQPASLSPYPEVDRMDDYNLNVAPHLPAELVESPPDIQNAPELLEDAIDSDVKYHVNIVENHSRFKPKLTLNPITCPGFSSLVQHIHNMLEDTSKKMKSIRVLGPFGPVDIADEDAWREVTTSVDEEEWMDGDVKIIVRIEEKS